MAISIDDFKAFLTERHQPLECKLCGGTEFQSSDGKTMKAAIPLAAIEATGDDMPAWNPPTLPLLWLSCTNCGNTIFISKKVIDQWKAEKDGAAKAND